MLRNPDTLNSTECLHHYTRFPSDFLQFKVDMRRIEQIHTAQTTKRAYITQVSWMLNSAFISYSMWRLFERYLKFSGWIKAVDGALLAAFWNDNTVEATGELKRKETILLK